MSFRLLIALTVMVLSLGLGAAGASNPMLVVAGYDSDNVVQFDLATGKWTELAKLPKGSQPRGITVSDGGEVFLGLHGGNKNIASIVNDPKGARLSNLSPKIGRFGPGFIVFGNGKLWAAGDTERVIYQVDPKTGEVSDPPQFRSGRNLVGLAVANDALYAAEYFQRSILRYDLKSGKTNAARLIEKSPHLNRPVGIALGHNGNLYVANGLAPTVVEFNVKTGEYVRTLVDIGAGGKDGIYGVVYAREVNRYYLASGSEVYEVDTSGTVLAVYNSPALKKAYGIALVPGGLKRASPRAVASLKPVDASRSSSVIAIEQAEVQPAVFAPITALKMTQGKLEIAGAPGERYRVLATTDFVKWESIAILENASGLLEFHDPDAAKYAMRFYRLEIIEATPVSTSK